MPRAKTKKAAPEEPAASEAGDDVVMNEPPESHQPAVEDANDEEDASMADQPAEEEEPVYEEEEDELRIRVLPGSTDHAASFEFLNEGHTLGNVLRYVIMKNPDVEFCAYAIPHPSEAKMNVRIQTYEGVTARQALEKGLRDVQDLCDIVTDKFLEARTEYSNKMSS
ncbi:hypothetical protein QBC47DRAFT_379051 [Echria macrotheca]|uniref:DNA-directed RNA polymerase RBP11-like dimerisation domain-containing protein n=1 Tax=Echria macrotheca TaxID=438768 RepID=A0AAJ0BD58_9PEZI|nr:hypothetical protein QBC47DRAFT_379051 [Echria macrotheca]